MWQGERTAQSLQTIWSLVSLLRLWTKLPVSTSCNTDTCSLHSGLRPIDISHRSPSSHLSLVTCSHCWCVRSSTTEWKKNPFVLPNYYFFFHPWNDFKAGFKSLFHTSVCFSACCWDLKPSVTFTISGVQMWQGAREGEEYILTIQGIIKNHCYCSKWGWKVMALHMSSISITYNLHYHLEIFIQVSSNHGNLLPEQ